MKESTVQKASLFGAMGAAITASVCCVGPLLLAVLGLGGAGMLVKLEPWRPLMTAVTVALLGVGFWVTYRKPAAAAGPACDCEQPTVHRVGRVGLWIVTALVAAFLAFPYLAPYLFF